MSVAFAMSYIFSITHPKLNAPRKSPSEAGALLAGP